ncbi:MAG: Fic family protein [Acidimicrobiales bacterium]
MPGTSVPLEWHGRSVDAYVPERLVAGTQFSAPTVRAAARAEGTLAAMGDRLGGLEVPARLLLRAEGIASSRIEGVEAPLDAIAVASADDLVAGDAGWVADNLKAVTAALAHRGRLRAADIKQWHRLLMVHSSLEPIHIGAWRDRIGWIGGPSPVHAAHVASPPQMLDELMRDLITYANSDGDDPVTQAALVHAQFETIHPFADGNGRIGRILIGWVLCRRLQLAVAPPVSIGFARDIGGYLSTLTLYRQVGPDPWVRWFAEAVEAAAGRVAWTLAAIAELEASWPNQLKGVRRDSATHKLLAHLVAHPALDVATAATLVGVSEQAARVALVELADRGVLREVATAVPTDRPGRPRRWWVAGDLLDLLGR